MLLGKGGEWVEPGSASALCLLAMDDSKENQRRPHALPLYLYSDVIAPFLRFEGPVNNQLYAIGGRVEHQDPLDVVEMFDTWHGCWVTCPRMLMRRAGCAVATLPDGRLLVAGGYNERGIVEGLLDCCEVFDPRSDRWSMLDSTLGRARWGHGCAVLGGIIYAVGGCSLRPNTPPHEAFMETLRSCETFDPATGAWSPCAADLQVARAGARVVALGDRYLAAVGGCDDVFGRASVLFTVELYDPLLGLWAVLGQQLSTPRTTAAVAALDDENIFIIGGAPSLSSAELYRVPNDGPKGTPASTSMADITEGRMGCQAVAMSLPSPGSHFPVCTRKCVVVVGGENGEDDVDMQCRQFSSVLVYDVEDDAWRTDFFPPIPTPRTAMALCVAPGMVRRGS